jgi:hypothetical protein
MSRWEIAVSIIFLGLAAWIALVLIALGHARIGS